MNIEPYKVKTLHPVTPESAGQGFVYGPGIRSIDMTIVSAYRLAGYLDAAFGHGYGAARAQDAIASAYAFVKDSAVPADAKISKAVVSIGDEFIDVEIDFAGTDGGVVTAAMKLDRRNETPTATEPVILEDTDNETGLPVPAKVEP